jgi:hypothetical protein
MSLTCLDLSNVIAEHGPFLLKPTGVVATGDPTYEQWEAATEWTKRCEKGSPWWLADLLAFGEHRYGEMYMAAIDATDFTYGTLATYVYVARNVEPSRRRQNLSFSHHQAVAPLTPAEQTFLLDRAEVEGLTVQQLRLHVKKVKAEATGHELEYLIVIRCDSIKHQRELAAQLRSQGRTVTVQVGGKW